MRPRSFFTLFTILVLTAAAQTVPSAASSQTPPGDTSFLTKVRGLFDFDLPDIDPPGTIKLTLHPHLGDLIRRDYMRVDTGFRWALKENFEINPEAAVYFTHGFGGGNDGYGIGELRLGSKYILRGWPDPDMETSVFVNVEVPVGSPPVNLTDGLNHFAPGFLVQHHSTRNRKLTTFAGAGLDLVSVSDIAGTPVRNQPLDDSMNFTAGAIYDLGQVKWTFSATYATTAVLGDVTEHFLYLRPSMLWYVPRKYTFNSKTQWLLGLGLRASWGPDGDELSFNTRVRAEVTFRQVVENIRSRRKETGEKP
ncbi:hypothetical protein ESB00_12480 [Oleiharenicola lentus]|uniref:Transporter n=1 Tax=Oleiharenicola lentus TaxID=2508720 RepID=A0A4Q1CCF7_9BACT|nr:hypothetical protein [Oleiharenicola lentus]RXK56646.1 hypothetical protein ESB00_12480 [Oleiharenicola lentus]